MSRRSIAVYALALLVEVVVLQGCPERDQPSRSESGNIIVYEPEQGDQIRSPFTVRGQARVFEAALSIRLVTDGGRELALVHTMASTGGPEFGDFSESIAYTRPPGVRRGIVEVFSYSPKDGSVINLVRIPVSLQ